MEHHNRRINGLMEFLSYFSGPIPLALMCCSRSTRFQGSRIGWQTPHCDTRLHNEAHGVPPVVSVIVSADDPLIPLNLQSWWIQNFTGCLVHLTITLAEGSIDFGNLSFIIHHLRLESAYLTNVIFSSPLSTGSLSELVLENCSRLRQVQVTESKEKGSLSALEKVTVSDCVSLTSFLWLAGSPLRELSNQTLYTKSNAVVYPTINTLSSLVLIVGDEEQFLPLRENRNLTHLKLIGIPFMECTLPLNPLYPLLRHLELSDINVASFDFLQQCPLLEVLQLKCPNLISLNTFHGLTQLQVLKLDCVSASFDVSCLQTIPTTLDTLWVDVRLHSSSMDIQQIPPLTTLQDLRGSFTDLNSISSRWPCLSHVDFQGSRCSLGEMAPLAELRGLERLNLSRVKGADISWLSALRQCKEIHLQRCTGVKDISIVETMSHLRLLNLSENKLPDISPLRGCSRLETLLLYEGEYGWSTTVPNGDFPSLRILDMHRSSGSALVSITRNCPLLVTLNLRCYKETFSLKSALPKRELRHLYLTNARTDFWEWEWIRNCPKVQTVELGRCATSKDFAILKDLTNIEVFIAEKCTDLKDLHFLSGSLRKVSVLRLSDCPCLSNIELLSSMRQVTKLSLRNCPSCHLDDLLLRTAAPLDENKSLTEAPLTPSWERSFLRNIKELDLSFCDLNDYSSLGQLKYVRRLNLSGSSLKSLEWVTRDLLWERLTIEGCTSLEDLSPLSVLPFLTEILATGSGVVDLHFVERCSTLQLLDIRDCMKVRSTSLSPSNVVVLQNHNVM